MLRYISFLNENVEQAKAYLKKINISENDPFFLAIKEISKRKPGYIGWLTKIAFEDFPSLVDKQILVEIKNIFNLIISNDNIIQLMDKPVIEYESYEKFLDAFEQAKLKIKAKKIYNEFPHKQKSFINFKKDYILLSNLYDDEEKQNFIKKIALYKTKTELLTAIKNFLETKSIKSNSLIDELKQKGLPIVYENEKKHIIIARILNYYQCSSVASKTSWCIARSSSTFNQYVNPLKLSIQYIIYLTDLPISDNNRIIGLTINVDGFNTAHNVVDNYVNKNDLTEILKDRGIDISELYVKKENIRKEDFDRFYFKSLLLYFTKDEIFKIKKSFNIDDLPSLTPEEIKKYNILEKIDESSQLNIILRYFPREEVLKKRKVFSLYDLQYIKLEELKDFNIINRVNMDNADVFKLKNYFDVEEILKRKEQYSIYDYQYIPKELIEKYNIIDKINYEQTTLRELLKFLPRDIVLQKKKTFSIIDSYELTKEELDKYDIMNQYSTNTILIFKYDKDEIIERGYLDLIPDNDSNGFNLFYLLDKGWTRSEIEKNIDFFLRKMSTHEKNYYNKYFKLKYRLPLSNYKYGYGNENRYNSDIPSYDLKKTMLLLKWYNVSPENGYSLSDLKYAIDDIRNFKDLENYLNLLKDLGFDLKDKYDVMGIIESRYRYSHFYVDDKISVFVTMKNLGYDIKDDFKNYLFENLRFRYTRPLDENSLDAIKEIFAGDDKIINVIEEHDTYNEFNYISKYVADEYWNRRKSDTISQIDYIEKWGEYGTKLHSANESFIAYMLILFKNDRYDLLNKIKIDFSKYTSTFSDTFGGPILYRLNGSITDTIITNGKSTYGISNTFTEEEREKAAKWIIENIYEKLPNKMKYEYDFIMLFFMYDKEKFYTYIDKIKKHGSGFNIEHLEPIFNFLFNKYNYSANNFFYKKETFDAVSEYENILNRYMTNHKLTKNDNYYKNYMRPENVSLKQITNKYFPTNENIMTDYLYFINERKKI